MKCDAIDVLPQCLITHDLKDDDEDSRKLQSLTSKDDVGSDFLKPVFPTLKDADNINDSVDSLHLKCPASEKGVVNSPQTQFRNKKDALEDSLLPGCLVLKDVEVGHLQQDVNLEEAGGSIDDKVEQGVGDLFQDQNCADDSLEDRSADIKEEDDSFRQQRLDSIEVQIDSLHCRAVECTLNENSNKHDRHHNNNYIQHHQQ